LAPLLPVGLWATLHAGTRAAGQGARRSPAWWPAGRLAIDGALLAAAAAVGAGAGLYLLGALAGIRPVPPHKWSGDVALAPPLAGEPGDTRLAVLNGPASFAEMYVAGPAGDLP